MEEEQVKKAVAAVHSQAVQMRRTLESPKGQLLMAVKSASTMLGELRTSKLPPNQYYELYNACFDALSQLQAHLLEAHQTHHLADVYEIVQYTGHVLPRLYLMITVGTAFIETDEAPIEEVLKDMLEMSRGVQHPLRGLFLRYYLGQRTARFIASPRTAAQIAFNVRFTLTNFIEMNKLWVRFAHQGHSREQSRRAAERVQLQTIVGSSILRLAQIDAVGVDLFQREIMPSILEQIVQCRDTVAQEYLLDVLVEVFPAEFHLETLETYLESLEFVRDDVKLGGVLVASINAVIRAKRRAKEEAAAADADTALTSDASATDAVDASDAAAAAADTADTSDSADATDATTTTDATTDTTTTTAADTSDATTTTDTTTADTAAAADTTDTASTSDAAAAADTTDAAAAAAADSSAAEPPSKQLAATHLVDFELDVYWKYLAKLRMAPSDRAVVAQKLLELYETLDVEPPLPKIFEFVMAEGVVHSDEVEKLILSVFDSQLPLRLVLNTLGSVTELLAAQSTDSIKTVTDKVITKFLTNDNSFGSKEHAEQVLGLFAVLLRSGKVSPANFRRLIGLLLNTESVESAVELLQHAYKLIREHGSTLMSIAVFAAIELLARSDAQSIGRLLKFATRACHDMATVAKEPPQALRMCVQCALAADAAGAEEAAYELFAQSLTVYEEHITDLSQQVNAMALIIQALQQSTSFTSENFDPLAQRCVQHGQRLFKKPEQCRTLLRAAHLFWDNNYADSRLVEETLARALRSADSVMDTALSIELFLDVLDTHLYFLSNETATVTVASVNNVLKLIKQNIGSAESEEAEDVKPLRARLERTNAFVAAHADEFPSFKDLDFEHD